MPRLIVGWLLLLAGVAVLGNVPPAADPVFFWVGVVACVLGPFVAIKGLLEEARRAR